VNPADTSQWLSQSDAAKIGSLCFGGATIGKYAVSGNYSSSALTCEQLPCQQGMMIFGGIGAAIFLLAPGGWKWAALIPAALAAMDCLGGF
jgi:hypothetical protein